MAQSKNSFALLDDEEGDDVAVLVDRIVKKVDDSLLHAQNEKEFVQDGSGPRRGDQGRRGGSRRNGYGGSDDIQSGYVQKNYRRNYSREFYGSGDVNKDYGRCDGNDGWGYVNEAAGDDNYQSGNNGNGWQDFSESHVKGDDKYDHTSGDGHRRTRNGNENYGGGYRVEVQYNDATDAQRRYRNRNWSSDGKRGVNGDQFQTDAVADGHGRYRNWDGSYDGEKSNWNRVQDNFTGDRQRRYRNGNQGRGNRRGDGDQTQNNDASYGNGNENRTNDGERIGSGDQIQDNDGVDRQRRYRNRNQSYDGQRRGYGDHTPNDVAVDSHRKYRNENWSHDGEWRGTEDRVQTNDGGYGQSRHRNGRQSFGGERKYYKNQVQDNNAGSKLLNVKGEVNEDDGFRGEGRTDRNGNRNYDGGRRGYGGYKGKDRQNYQTGEVEDTGYAAGGLDVKAERVNNYRSYAALVLEDSKAEGSGDINFPKEESAQTKQEESELKKKQSVQSQQKKEDEDEEAKLMTLDEYEKLLFEKRQLLESRKTRERIVAIDKDLEGMRLIKKQDDPDEKLKSEEKLQKKGNIEKKEKGSKLAVHELFKPAFRRRSYGRGGREHGDQGGLNDQTHNYNGPRTNGNGNASRALSQHRGLLAVPTDKDFPVLSASASASTSSSAVKS